MQYIRADANSEIATGHIMRCMAIASQMKKMGEQVTFIIADEFPLKMLEDKGFYAIVLGTDWRNKNLEIPILENLIEEKDIKLLLVDSYQVTPEYFKALKKKTKVAYLDDINAFFYDVNIIINYNDYYNEFNYEKEYLGHDVKLWLGCQYTPLRKEFSNVPYKTVKESVTNVMVTTGGADTYKISECVIKTLANIYPEIKFHIVVGRFFENREELNDLKKIYKNIILYENVNMAELMKKCDVAISAGGTTLYELCACAVPSLCFMVADNQSKCVEIMANEKVMLYLGDIRDGIEIFEKSLLKQFEIMQDYELRRKLSYDMKRLVDGQGAKRIAEKLINENK